MNTLGVLGTVGILRNRWLMWCGAVVVWGLVASAALAAGPGGGNPAASSSEALSVPVERDVAFDHDRAHRDRAD